MSNSATKPTQLHFKNCTKQILINTLQLNTRNNAHNVDISKLSSFTRGIADKTACVLNISHVAERIGQLYWSSEFEYGIIMFVATIHLQGVVI